MIFEKLYKSYVRTILRSSFELPKVKLYKNCEFTKINNKKKNLKKKGKK